MRKWEKLVWRWSINIVYMQALIHLWERPLHHLPASRYCNLPNQPCVYPCVNKVVEVKYKII